MVDTNGTLWLGINLSQVRHDMGDYAFKNVALPLLQKIWADYGGVVILLGISITLGMASKKLADYLPGLGYILVWLAILQRLLSGWVV